MIAVRHLSAVTGRCASRRFSTAAAVAPARGTAEPSTRILSASLPATEEMRQEFEIDRHDEIGRGATSVVYGGTKLSTGQKVAVKQSPRGPQSGLPKEWSLLNTVNHENVVRTFGIYGDDRNVFLVMERCTGGTLEARARLGSMPALAATQAIQEVLSAVSHLHSLRIVHRDIKMGNFVYSTSAATRRLKCIDLGAASILPLGDMSAKLHKWPRQATVGYVAPEVLRRLPYDESADMFSVGALFHTLLSGRPPQMQSGYLSRDGDCYKVSSPNSVCHSLGVDTGGWQCVREATTRFTGNASCFAFGKSGRQTLSYRVPVCQINRGRCACNFVSGCSV
mmetsp:Transcript_8430/g.20985  ORF Transcript_8430/g.20985 Transcript_8430/m.20985 type:complete len:337 (-) Transcript_8430:249-1259(-)